MTKRERDNCYRRINEIIRRLNEIRGYVDGAIDKTDERHWALIEQNFLDMDYAIDAVMETLIDDIRAGEVLKFWNWRNL